MNQPHLSKREFMFAFPSVIIGISILSLPSSIADATSFSDGWIPILIAGIMATLLALLAVHVASYFPGKPFLEYAPTLVTKPIAILFALVLIISHIFLAGFITRTVAYIAQQYLFERTPMEVLALLFLLVVIYAVCGSRVGLFRLNMLFLPIILFIFIFVGMFNIKSMEIANFFPLFKTSMKGYAISIREAFLAYLGFGLGIYYVFMIKNPFNMTKKIVMGMSISILFYLFIFLSSIAVFNNTVTSNMLLPTLGLALKVDIPGAIFERIDAFVYTIWIMAVFNTVTITYDIAVLMLKSMFQKRKKSMIVFIIGPIIFFVGMFPRSMDFMNKLLYGINIFYAIFISCMIILFYIIIKWKGIPRYESS